MKRKFSLWLNVVTICLCLCAIAVGVYSATTANLNASGKVAFTAHNCDVTIAGSIYGHATGNNPDGLPVAEADAEPLGTVTLAGTTGTMSLGERYFTDMASDDGSAENIVVTLTVTNTSKFDITASVTNATVTSGTPITISSSSTSQKVAQNANVTFTFTLTLTNTANDIDLDDLTSDNVTISMHFEKYSSPYYVENNKLYVDMGTDPDTGEAIRWYAIAKDKETLKATNFTDVSQATAGTYVFISEYILENSTGGNYIAFNSTMDSTNNYGANYGGSTIQTYINGTGTGSIGARYNFSSSEIWANINPYDCASETVTDYDTSSDVTIPATNDQTLWLLSKTEYENWFGDGNSSGIGYLLDNTSTAGCWWLRSANGVLSDDVYSYVFFVNGDGDVGSDIANNYNRCGAHVAFEITISA